jgi:mono/diheme cytochrome c family protein
MKATTSRISLLIVFGLSILLFSFAPLIQQKKPWNVPENDKKMKNTVKSDGESISTGKALYAKHCKSCHGKGGEGDGTKAAELKTEPGDFTSKAFQGQTDGELFYKTSEGRDDMPSFKKKIPENEDVWAIVNYLRTLGVK